MTSEPLPGKDFGDSLGCLTRQAIAGLAAQLSSITRLSENEREVIRNATSATLLWHIHAKLARTLVVELNNARMRGDLRGATPEERWQDFLSTSSQEQFWLGLEAPYPTLRPRINKLINNAITASLRFANRWAADRDLTSSICGNLPGELTSISFGAGDTHCGGQTVAILTVENGKLLYKPRSLAVDRALDIFIKRLEKHCGRRLWMRVPAVITRSDYGWAEFIEHQYAINEEELGNFYEGMGHWLAVLRVLGGVDFHAENLIANRATPVIVDCETLFAPRMTVPSSQFGEATDTALRYIAGTVLATGLLPFRGVGLGFRGVDVSGIGSLPDQQPVMRLPAILDTGTDRARIGLLESEGRRTQNHPAPEPRLVEHWHRVQNSFSILSRTFRSLDRNGELRTWLSPFEDCRVRVIVRATEPYSEVARMLWHPVSLHNEPAARGRARELLLRMAENLPLSPSDPVVVDAEIEDLLIGDIPYFSTVAREGAFEGPADTRWFTPGNLVEAALRRWREANLALEESYMRLAIVSAYTDDDLPPSAGPVRPAIIRIGDFEKRRRRQAALIMEKLVSQAIRGRDGTVAWIAPTRLWTGWAVQPVGDDLYNGIAGLAVLCAAYTRECAAGRADPVSGADELLASLLNRMQISADRMTSSNRQQPVKERPQVPGSYLGIGSLIWSWLLLSEFGAAATEAKAHAVLLAAQIPDAVAAYDENDILMGSAGAIPPLLGLFAKTGDEAFLRMAESVGDIVCGRAKRDEERAWWAHDRWPDGLGGLSHGATGIGWCLHKLADVSAKPCYRETARAAFAFEDSLFDQDEMNWLDLRKLPDAPKAGATWCHGAVGIGLARFDLDPELTHESTRRSMHYAAKAAWARGWGWNHCACHGDASSWEVLDRAISIGEGPKGVTNDDLMAGLLTTLEDGGVVSGMLRDAFVPGLMSGAGGMAYQLLRADPAAHLPTFLLPGKLNTLALIPASKVDATFAAS